MARGGSSRRGGRSVSSPGRRTRNDHEAGLLRGPARANVSPARSAQARARGALSRTNPDHWARFHELGDLLWPSTSRFQEAEWEFHVAKETVAAGEEGAVDRLEDAREELQYARVLMNSTFENYLK